MVSSTAPLTREELTRLLASLDTFQPREGYYEHLDPVRVVRFMLMTRVHPEVVADREKSGLMMDGPRHLTWRRPKTKRMMRVPVDPEIQPWVKEFVETLPQRTRMTINRLVHDVGANAGMPALTPRTLRHSFLRILADKTHDIDDVMRYGGCSLAVAVRYVRTADSERDKAFFDGGLLQRAKESGP